MDNSNKTREQLLNELAELYQKLTDLKTIEKKHHEVETVLRENEEKYRSMVESTDDSIYMVDKNYRYLFANRKFLSRLNVSEDRLIGKTYGAFHTPEETKVFIDKIDTVFSTGESIQHEYQSPRDGGYYLRTLSPVKAHDGVITAVTIISKNVTKLKQLEEELRFLSLTDELTGLFNRRGFLTLAEQQLRMARRLKMVTFMLYADLDNLKIINDSFGHKEGDRALIDTAKILKMTCRDSDIIARIGGDEFAVFPIGTTEEFAGAIISRLNSNFELHNTKENRGYNLSLSVGVTRCEAESNNSIHDFLVQADLRMYEQKRNKRKTF